MSRAIPQAVDDIAGSPSRRLRGAATLTRSPIGVRRIAPAFASNSRRRPETRGPSGPRFINAWSNPPLAHRTSSDCPRANSAPIKKGTVLPPSVETRTHRDVGLVNEANAVPRVALASKIDKISN